MREEQSVPGFTLRLPFVLSPGFRLTGSGAVVVGETAMELSGGDDDYVLVASGMESEVVAAETLRRLEAALLWTSLQLQGGIRSYAELKPLIRLPEPAPADALVPGLEAATDYGAAIYEDGLKVAAMRANPLSVSLGYSLERFANNLRVGLDLGHAVAALDDPKVRLAAQLYTDSWFELSDSAKFFIRMTVLEALKRESDRPDEIVTLIDEWMTQAKARREAGAISSHEAQSVLTGLSRLKQRSIGQSIRALVAEYLGEEHGQRTGRLYSFRSRMVHGERVAERELVKSLQEVTTLVRTLLSAILSRAR